MHQKILIVNFTDCYGGGEVYLELLIKGLASSGEFDITTVSPDIKRFVDNIKDDSKLVYGVNRSGKFISLRNLSNYLKQAILINKFIKVNNIDIIFLNGKESFYLAPLLTAKVKKIAVNHVVGISGSGIFLKKLLTAKSLDKVDKLIFVSQKAKLNFEEMFAQKYCNKITVIKNGINGHTIEKKSNSSFRSESNTVNLMIIGRLQNIKGHKELIDVFYELLKKYKNIKLIIAGEGEEKERIQHQVERFNISDKVDLKGYIPVEDVICESDIVILPSYTESFPLVLLEAMAAGKAIISTLVGGVPEIIEDGKNGFLIEPINKKQLYDKLEILIIDKELREKMGQNGYALYKEKYTAEIFVKKTISVIDDLLKESR